MVLGKGDMVMIKRFIAMTTILMVSSLAAYVKAEDLKRDNPYGTSGVSHIGLTVSKLDETAQFFTQTLGWRPAGGRADYPAKFVTNGVIFLTLWQATDPKSAVAFNRKTNVGLHHLAIQVATLEQLNGLYEKLQKTPNVEIEFGPEFMGSGPTTHMIIRDPSGLRLEFIVHL